MSFHRFTANSLSVHARNLLIEHIDGGVAVSVPIDHARAVVLSALISRDLVRFHRPGGTATTRPRSTRLTEDGRAVLGYVLGNTADRLAKNEQRQDEVKSPRLRPDNDRALDVAEAL